MFMLKETKKRYIKFSIFLSIFLIIILTLFSVFSFINSKNNTNELVSKTFNDSYSGSTKLESLLIKNQEGDISFNSDTFSYNVNLYSSLKSIDIEAIPQDSNANVVIDGNKYLYSNGTITITVSNNGNSSVYTIDYTRTKTDVVTNFSLAQSGQEYSIDSTGYYKLEVWGAAGGYRNSSSYGFGGYAIGFYNGVIGDKLYAYTGYQGTGYRSGTSTAPGGFNGGGTGGYGNQGGSGGGGASHIAINLKR